MYFLATSRGVTPQLLYTGGREIVIAGHRTWSIQLQAHYLPAKPVLTPEIYIQSANYTVGQANVCRLIRTTGRYRAEIKWRWSKMWKESVRRYSDTETEVLGKTTTILSSDSWSASLEQEAMQGLAETDTLATTSVSMSFVDDRGRKCLQRSTHGQLQRHTAHTDIPVGVQFTVPRTDRR